MTKLIRIKKLKEVKTHKDFYNFFREHGGKTYLKKITESDNAIFPYKGNTLFISKNHYDIIENELVSKLYG